MHTHTHVIIQRTLQIPFRRRYARHNKYMNGIKPQSQRKCLCMKGTLVELGRPPEMHKFKDNGFFIDSKVLNFILDDKHILVNKKCFKILYAILFMLRKYNMSKKHPVKFSEHLMKAFKNFLLKKVIVTLS